MYSYFFGSSMLLVPWHATQIITGIESRKEPIRWLEKMEGAGPVECSVSCVQLVSLLVTVCTRACRRQFERILHAYPTYTELFVTELYAAWSNPGLSAVGWAATFVKPLRMFDV